MEIISNTEALKRLLKDVMTIAITCKQWGDTGKGKFVDLFSDWADIIVRGTGGENAGHTIVYNGETYIFHLVPSGILFDNLGKVNIIGNGTVIYPKTLLKELGILSSKNLSYKNLKLAFNAKLVLPQHIVLDRATEFDAGNNKVGTTGKGIGPAYADHVSRHGLVVNDILNKTVFIRKLKRNLKHSLESLKNYDQELLKTIMQDEHLESGLYYDPETIFNEEAIINKYMEYGEQLKDIICDTDAYIRDNLGKKHILLEGAQGDLLSVDYGSYHYVTSSDCSLEGLTKGAGLKASDVDMAFGIIKGFYMTRVGGGPFPTELGGEQSEVWCGGATKIKELETFGKHSVNDSKPFIKGVALRIAGGEYGATTGRCRRIGWLDLALLRYSLLLGSKNIILTKLDVLNDLRHIPICTHYIYRGEPYQHGERLLSPGDIINTAIMAADVQKYCEPVYREFDGWLQSLKNCKRFDDLPQELKNILDFIVEETGIIPRIISVGPDREETIFVN